MQILPFVSRSGVAQSFNFLKGVDEDDPLVLLYADVLNGLTAPQMPASTSESSSSQAVTEKKMGWFR